jgi:hypothetical protein
MRLEEVERAPQPAGPLATLNDEIGLFEMANLSSAQTGVDGVISISTAQVGHGPRVNWYTGRPRDGAPCLTVTIEASPAAMNKNLPQNEADAAAGGVQAWVTLNQEALLAFWTEGNTWLDDDVAAFKRGLRRLP